MVTCWPPIRPAIRVPLNTRDGVAQAPIEPGERCFLWLPWEAPWPLKLWRFMPAGEALALGHGDGVDQLAGLEQVGGQLLAHLVVGGVVDPELDQPAAGVDPGLVEVALLGLGQGRCPPVAPGDLQGGVALALGGLDLHDPDRRDAHHRHRYRPVSGRPRSGSFPLFRPRSPWWPLELLRLDSSLRPTPAGADRLLQSLLELHPALHGITAELELRIGLHADAPLGEPERSARLVWSEVPAVLRRALGHVLLTWFDPNSGRPATIYHPTPAAQRAVGPPARP